MTTNLIRLQYMVRCMSVMAAFEILLDFVSPALWILTTPNSIIARVASLSSSSEVMGGCWLIAAAMVVPFVVMQLAWPAYKYRRPVIKLCNYGNLFGGLLWFLMAFMARNLDYGYIVPNFIVNGMGSFFMAALLANSLNNDQIEFALLPRTKP